MVGLFSTTLFMRVSFLFDFCLTFMNCLLFFAVFVVVLGNLNSCLIVLYLEFSCEHLSSS
jgi:hypothetical protein